MALQHERAARGGIADGAFGDTQLGGEYPNATPTPTADQQFTEFLTGSERAAVRRIWWNQRALGFRLPAERGVIIMPGGAR